MKDNMGISSTVNFLSRIVRIVETVNKMKSKITTFFGKTIRTIQLGGSGRSGQYFLNCPYEIPRVGTFWENYPNYPNYPVNKKKEFFTYFVLTQTANFC